MLLLMIICTWKSTELQVNVQTVCIFCDIFSNINQILCRDRSFESSQRDDSNEWSQHSNSLRNKKISIWGAGTVTGAPTQSQSRAPPHAPSHHHLHVKINVITVHTVYTFCDIFSDVNRILCRDHSLESSQRHDSNEWSQHRNRLGNKDICIWIKHNIFSVICSSILNKSAKTIMLHLPNTCPKAHDICIFSLFISNSFTV